MKNRPLMGKNNRPLWEGHRERLRRRMEREGWDALRPHEMVELVIFHCVPRRDVSGVARMLVDRMGNVGGVFSATREQLLEVPGVTPNIANWIVTTGNLIRAYHGACSDEDILVGSYQEVLDFLRPRLSMRKRAGLWILYADFNYHLLTFSEYSPKKAWWRADLARRMVADSIGIGARYVFLVLWTDDVPKGMSPKDTERLEAISYVLRAAELELLDCILVGGGEFYSMNVNGGMKRIRASSDCMALHERYVAQQ